MRTKLRGRIALLFMTCALLIAVPAVAALADVVQNNIDTTVDATVEQKTIVTDQSTQVGYKLVTQNNDTTYPDTNGCNAQTSNPVSVSINTPTGVTASPSSLSFSDCGATQFVTFTATKAGTHNITVSASGGKDGTTTHPEPAAWDLIVNKAQTGISAVSGTGNAGASNGSLTATLKNIGVMPNKNLSGESIEFKMGTTSLGSANTDTSGVATLSNVDLSSVSQGTHSISANFAEGADYLASSGSGNLVVGAPLCTTPAAPVFATKSAGFDGSNGWFKTVPTILATSTSSGATITYATEVNGGAKSAYSATAPTLGQGTTKVYAKATSGTCPASETIDTFKVDTVSPSINDDGTTQTPNGAGWFNTAVTNNFSASDATSGLADAMKANFSVSSTTEGSAVKINSGPVSDNAGNTNSGINSAAFQIDLTKPSVSVTGVSQGATYTIGAVPTAGCSTTDALSGPDQLATVGVTGGTLLGVGNFTATCSGGTDVAGNSQAAPVSVSYKVVTNWSGFSSPVDNLPTMNSAKAGQAIPLKWRITDSGGNPISNLSSVTVTVQSLGCSLGTTTDALEEYAAGSSGLQNLGNGYYQFNWKSPTSYASSCKTLHLDMGEGLTRQAAFKFTK